MPQLKMPRLAEFEEWAAMPGAEGVGLEVRDMPEPECETSVVAEPTLVAEATEMPQLRVWNKSEPERKAPVSKLEHEAPVAEVDSAATPRSRGALRCDRERSGEEVSRDATKMRGF
jgi:hypothetical protein